MVSRHETSPVNHSFSGCHNNSPGAVTKARMDFQPSMEVITGIGHFLNLIYSPLSLASFELNKLRLPDNLVCFYNINKGKSKILMGIFTCFVTQYYFQIILLYLLNIKMIL